ncbi:XRE family transcriptional regulator [Faecalibacterium sp. Marseille-P9312]|uniref:LexA family protein n=1 Tax=Faecalibacterium sp. Marseille-P9312 TaxID=2580425 RepID=UPI00122C9659|nr:XRE family transcriptional regulator [Faecalibacterium sp. Marseille-P9312]
MVTVGDRIRQVRQEQDVTQQELADYIGISKQAVYKYENNIVTNIPTDKVDAIAKRLKVSPAYLMGWEEQPTPKPTSPAPIPPGFEPMPKMKKIPLIGSIACGEPITAEQNIEKMVDVPESIRCDFSLTCHGDSMVDAGIHDKDVVYIRTQPEVENGEIAAVRIDGEATLKRVYYNPGTLTLMPANPAYAPMVYTGSQLEEVHIEGKVVGWTHWVG